MPDRMVALAVALRSAGLTTLDALRRDGRCAAAGVDPALALAVVAPETAPVGSLYAATVENYEMGKDTCALLDRLCSDFGVA